MNEQHQDGPPQRALYAQLEDAFLDEYLQHAGSSRAQLRELPDEQAQALMRAACLFAALRLTAVETRAHWLRAMHGGAAAGYPYSNHQKN